MSTPKFPIQVCLALISACSIFGADAEENGSPLKPMEQIDPATGQSAPTSAANFQSELERVANQMTTLTGSVSGQKGLYEPLTTKNAETLAEKVHARDSSGVGLVDGPGISFGGATLSFGGEAVDLDSRQSYYSAPTVYQFIGEGKNRFQALDSRMQRATKWLNKHTCGGFDWSAQFTSMFRTEVLVDYVKNLGEGVVAAAPMALLGAFAPQLAEIVKWLKLTVGFDLSSVKADCAAIEQNLTHGIRSAAWSEAYADCMARYTDAKEAVRNCNNPETMGAIQKSDGTRTNPNTSQAAATGANWETNGFNQTKDWVDSLFKPADTAAATATTAGSNGSTTGQQQAQEQGIAAAATGAASNAVKTILGRGRDPAMNRYAKALFGEINFSGTGALEVGRKRFTLFKLSLDNEAAAMQSTFEAQLVVHYGLLANLSADRTTLQQSYSKCKLWTYHVRGSDSGIQPWTQDPVLMGRIQSIEGNKGAGIERFSDQTIDALAYLMNYLNLERGNPTKYVYIEREWEVKMFMAMVCKYEFLLYVEEEMIEVKKDLDALAGRVSSAGNSGDAHMLEERRKQYDSAMQDLQESTRIAAYYVATRLAKINSYRPPNVGRYAPSVVTAPNWLVTPPGLGR